MKQLHSPVVSARFVVNLEFVKMKNMDTGTFIHSVKVPRLYKCAASVLKKSGEFGVSIKNSLYEQKHKNLKGIYALAVQALEHKDDLNILIETSQLLVNEPKFDPWLARILITELIWGKKRLGSECKPIQKILSYEHIFKKNLPDSSTDDHKIVKKMARFVRVNSLKISLNDVVKLFRDEGWILQKGNTSDYKRFLKMVEHLQENEFMVDIHVDNLLIFPLGEALYKNPLYLDGKLLLQDKASCFPAQLLNPTEGSTILDMCAAPGMKTTQLAALINNKGKIFAIEKDSKRCEVLRTMVAKAGATCVEVLNKDALAIDEEELLNAEYILVDPSCSGSGIQDRIDYDSNTADLKVRLQKLSIFQRKLLNFALRKFPKAKRVVYSTCSIYSKENEDIVSDVISTNRNYKLVPIKEALKAPWNNFASNEQGSIGSHCLYAKPKDDMTNGFFTAVFERLEEGEKNEFFKDGKRFTNEGNGRKRRLEEEGGENYGKKKKGDNKNLNNQNGCENTVKNNNKKNANKKSTLKSKNTGNRKFINSENENLQETEIEPKNVEGNMGGQKKKGKKSAIQSKLQRGNSENTAVIKKKGKKNASGLIKANSEKPTVMKKKKEKNNSI